MGGRNKKWERRGMMKRIVCLCGYKRSGKDYVASILRERHGYQHVQIAHKLKDMLRVMFGFTDEQLHGSLKEVVDPVWKITPRRAMEFVGTEMVQYDMQKFVPGIGRNFWIKSVTNELNDALIVRKRNVVISDLRFQHEIDALKRNFPHNPVVLVRVDHPRVVLNSTHASETNVDHLRHDLLFHNDKVVLEETTQDVMRMECGFQIFQKRNHATERTSA
jgi:hypothetical protein